MSRGVSHLGAVAFLVVWGLGCAMCTAAPTPDDDSHWDGKSTGGSSPGSPGAGGKEPGVPGLKPPTAVHRCEEPDPPPECEITVAPACGDGVINLEPSEPCDDGNARPGDGCSGACVVEPFFECPVAGEPCVSTIHCGDAALGPGEACDDGNQLDGDGCSASCQQVERGYSCRQVGAACVRIFVCGDGVVDPNEGCDDGNNQSEDGCDARCRIEDEYKCEGEPSECSGTTCGDGVREGAESCDDGNRTPFDGCGTNCRAEPICAGGPCSSTCGDGIMLGAEQCDDGNSRDGDGCSSECQKEEGFRCSQPDSCEGQDCTLELPIIYRDFAQTHGDFGVACGTIQRGIPKARLSDNGKPELSAASYADACIQSVASFAEWYTDAGTNAEVVSSIVLYSSDDGSYVNRFGPDGEPYLSPPTGNGRWCGNRGVYESCAEASDAGQCNGAPFDPLVDTCWEIGAVRPDNVPPNCCADCFCAGTVNQEAHDGNPLFFPVEELMGSAADLSVASVPQEVYGGGWQEDPSGELRNFFFTSEIAYWFEYTEGMTAQLSFVGDDDMWVFVNGRLAVDLGGLHVPVEGRFTLNADGSIDLIHGTDETGDRNEPARATVADFGLEPGNVYEVKVFQAERKKSGSSYRLTLSGFSAGASDCVTDCGDGEVGPSEECDDGEASNLGGYGQCTADCTFGPHCGDAIKQDEEACDYGTAKNTGAYGGCSPACELGPYCGDGFVSPEEECDDGANDGGYGECAPGCQLGPLCGDGVTQLAFEECDDGNNIDRDGCSAACKEEVVVL